MTVKGSCFTYKRYREITSKNTQKGKESPICTETVHHVYESPLIMWQLLNCLYTLSFYMYDTARCVRSPIKAKRHSPVAHFADRFLHSEYFKDNFRPQPDKR